MRALTIPILITRHGYRACHIVNFVLALRMKFPTECNDYRDVGHLRAAVGSVARVRLSNRPGRATRQKRTQSATPLRVQNSDAAKFACWITLARWSA